MLDGDNPSERFESFSRSFEDHKARIKFLKKYPVLARYAVKELSLWCDASTEFLTNLSNDWSDIRENFGLEASEKLSTIQPSGDTHNDGRSVVIISFTSGRRILYKPRNIKVEIAFQKTLEWLNNGINTNHKIINVITYKDHGWVEFLENDQVKTDLELERYYYRLGSLLSLLHSLNTVDIHFENLVAHGEYPCIVDLETLFHEDLSKRSVKTGTDYVRMTIDESVLSVGILPQPSKSLDKNSAFDISAIGASENQVAPYNVVGIDNFGRDDIKITNIPGWIPSVHNQPNDSTITKIPLSKIMEGYSDTYDFILRERDFLLSEKGPLSRFKECHRRLIMRNTRHYGSLQMDAFHPDFLRDDLDRAWHWDNLWNETNTRPEVEQFIPSEMKQIENHDIPHFSVKIDGSRIRGTDGKKIKGIDLCSGWESARKRILNMSDEDKALQLWIIKSSIGDYDNHKKDVIRQNIICKTDYLDGACSIANMIVKNLIEFNEMSSFLTVESILGENNIASKFFSVKAADSSLYDGSAGVALFLAYLSKFSDDGYQDSAKLLISNIRKEISEDKLGKSISGYIGLGSLVYCFTHIWKLWGDDSFRVDIDNLLEKIGPEVTSNNDVDVLLGHAGCILALTPYLQITNSSLAKAIVTDCADKLLDCDEQGVPYWKKTEYKRGLSHGASGIAMALSRIGKVIPNPDYCLASEQIIEYENKLIQGGKWTDTHKINGKDQVSWCHGASGIAIARLSINIDKDQLSGKDVVLEEALREVRNNYWMDSHCLCHGTIGNLEPIFDCQKYSIYPDFCEEYEKSLSKIFNDIKKNGWHSLLPSQTQNIGLMTGLSGLGYFLLRQYENEIPSVLSMEAPPKKLF